MVKDSILEDNCIAVRKHCKSQYEKATHRTFEQILQGIFNVFLIATTA